MILSIAKFEYQSFWRTHIGWASHCAIALVLGYMFVGYIDQFLQHWQNQSSISDAILSPLFGDAAVLALFLVPLIAARSAASDSRQSPNTVLLLSPISSTQIVFGKLLGIVAFLAPMLLVLLAACIALSFGSAVDASRVAANFVGLTGVIFVLASLSLLLATLVNHTLAATMLAYGVLILLWILDLTITTEGAGVISYAAIMPHFEAPRRGWISSIDLAYFVIATLACTFGSARILSHRMTAGAGNAA